MRIPGLFLVILVSMALISCCSGKKAGKENTPGDVKTQNSGIPDSKKIIGIWQGDVGKVWFEFRVDGTYDMGKADSIITRGKLWTLDENTAKVSIMTNKNVIRKMDYSFDGDLLILKMGKRKTVHRLKKIANRPVQ